MVVLNKQDKRCEMEQKEGVKIEKKAIKQKITERSQGKEREEMRRREEERRVRERRKGKRKDGGEIKKCENVDKRDLRCKEKRRAE